MKGCRSGQAPPTGELAARLGRREQERRALHQRHSQTTRGAK